MLNPTCKIETGQKAIIAWGKTKFVESRKIKDGTLTLTTFILNQGKNPNWQESNNKKDKDYYIKCKCFGELADSLQSLPNNMRVTIFGEKQVESYKNKDGVNITEEVILVNVVSNNIILVNSVQEEQFEELEQENNNTENQLPF